MSASAAIPTGHAHHWLLDSPNGPLAHARCKTCGAETEFLNAGVAERGADPISRDMACKRRRKGRAA